MSNIKELEELLKNALQAHQNNELKKAEKIYKKILNIQPTQSNANHNLGVIYAKGKKIDLAKLHIERAYNSEPNNEMYKKSFANILKEYNKTNLINENPIDYKIASLFNQNKINDALTLAKQEIQKNQNYAFGYKIVGIIYYLNKDLMQAAKYLEQSKKINPSDCESFYNLGLVYYHLGFIDKAKDNYLEAIKQNPNYSEAYSALGNIFRDNSDFSSAKESYLKAIEINPNFAEAYSNLGIVSKLMGNLDKAIEVYKIAIEINPNFAEAYANLANAYKDKGLYKEAINNYKKSISLKSNEELIVQTYHLMQHICDWHQYSKMVEDCKFLGLNNEAIPPFSALSMEDNPQNQLQRSKIWASNKFNFITEKIKSKQINNRIKIGYFTSDFYNHATLHLISGLFRCHDTTKFEINIYSYGTKKLEVDQFNFFQNIENIYYLETYSNIKSIELIKSHCLDIAIDLKGYTQDTKSELFQFNLAPIQINYLGYPGTMGTTIFDYIIADPVVIPNEYKKFNSEKIIYLPHTYQCNDNKRSIGKFTKTKFDYNLPENSFVFCCFNNNYKISPVEFDIWMRILDQTENSILWLLKSNKWAEENLKKEAKKRGIDPNRLIFAEKVSAEEHLFRHQFADLFIDTFNYNAHTTASDALWSNLPIITKIGKQFCARVASSLLIAIDLPELITQTPEEYEELILELANDPIKLNKIKDKLINNKNNKPLFDTLKFTKDFEKGLEIAYKNYLDDKFEDIYI